MLLLKEYKKKEVFKMGGGFSCVTSGEASYKDVVKIKGEIKMEAKAKQVKIKEIEEAEENDEE